MRAEQVDNRSRPAAEQILRTYLTLALVSTGASWLIWGIMNGMTPSAQRATVLSSDNLLGSGGGVAFQPALGKVADVWGYGLSYVVGAGIQLLALPLMLLARREGAPSDEIDVVRPERRPADLDITTWEDDLLRVPVDA